MSIGSGKSILDLDNYDEDEECEIGNEACWKVSSARKKHGIKCVCDKNTDTFWHSEGVLPHRIEIFFKSVAKMKAIEIFTNFENDQSHTPQLILVETGTNQNNLRELIKFQAFQPKDWIKIPLVKEKYLQTKYLRISILLNHKEGRDSIIRDIRLIGIKTKSESFGSSEWI